MKKFVLLMVVLSLSLVMGISAVSAEYLFQISMVNLMEEVPNELYS